MIMGDATHNYVAALVALMPNLQAVAGYDSGTPDIDWTDADWAQFPGIPHIHIDQGYNSTLNTEAHAMAFDIEPGAYQPAQAGQLISINTTPRPTVYCDRAQLAATVASALTSPRFRGDVWLAFPGWQPGQPLPSLPATCRYVAVQNQFAVTYDLSLILDPTWPQEATMSTPPAKPQIQADVAYCGKCRGFYYGPEAALSVCPAGGQHAPANDISFGLLYAG